MNHNIFQVISSRLWLIILLVIFLPFIMIPFVAIFLHVGLFIG
ncbi:hypothetical protein COLU111180_13730 [Cohnella lubricantis]|nr:hypothetical protein [Cohnella lubricantis]